MTAGSSPTRWIDGRSVILTAMGLVLLLGGCAAGPPAQAPSLEPDAARLSVADIEGLARPGFRHATAQVFDQPAAESSRGLQGGDVSRGPSSAVGSAR